MFILIYYILVFWHTFLLILQSNVLILLLRYSATEMTIFITSPHLHYFILYITIIIVILLFLLFLLPMMANGMVVNKSVGSRPNVTGFAFDWGE